RPGIDPFAVAAAGYARGPQAGAGFPCEVQRPMLFKSLECFRLLGKDADRRRLAKNSKIVKG
ncbi:MAG: hypothetical protein WCK17_18205, partial [Verrucomicrobiota bacterium]